MRKLLPSSHPDIDDLFDNSTRVLPDWHIDLSDLLTSRKMQRVEVPRGHPNPMEMYYTLEPTPKNHPSVISLLQAYLPPDHPENLDEMLKNPADFPLPGFHPNLASFLLPKSAVQVQEESSSQETVSEEAVSGETSKYEPAGTESGYDTGISETDDYSYESASTDDYASLFVDSLESAYYVPTFSVWFGHPNLSTDYDMGDPIDNHPSIYYMFEKYLPEGHPNIDEMMRTGFILPSYHPDIRAAVEPRPLVTSPASLLSYSVAAILLLILLVRSFRKLKSRTMEIPPPPKILENDTSIPATLADSVDSDIDEPVGIHESSVEVGVPSLNQRRHHAMELNQNHHDDNLGPQENVHQNIIAYKEKKNTVLRTNWNKAFGRRMVKSDVSMGEAVNCLFYIIINIAALLASPYCSYALGFGSLSAGNTLFLVMTA